MKTYIKLLFLAALLVAGFWIYTQQVSNHFKSFIVEKVEFSQIKEPVKKVITPPPLKGPIKEIASELTTRGIVFETNQHRQANNLPALAENKELALMAQIKAEDIFEKQYFAHESPTGQGPSDLANTTGYEYIVVGENLAMGNFEDDKDLVQAWMNSPGHRENILNSSFSEIGVAVLRGNFEGQAVWVAVQEFGRPASECPEPDENLLATIESKEKDLDLLLNEISDKEEAIEKMQPKRGPAYRQAVNEYNALINQYNFLLKEIQGLIEKYNQQVVEYNNCI